jgi:hypothetical protein
VAAQAETYYLLFSPKKQTEKLDTISDKDTDE